MKMQTEPPASGANILEIARGMRGSLRKSDRKVCDVVLADPRRILTATVAETADLAEVSQPTVIRFCTAIGCEGFQDFKLRLAQALALGLPATHSVIADTDTPDDVAVMISNTAATRSIVEIARLARARGARVIGLVGMRGALTAECDIVLRAETLENSNIYTPTISRIAALTVIDILSTSVALRRGAAHMEDVKEMKQALSELRITL